MMYKIIVAGLLSVMMVTAETANAQVSVGVNTGGYGRSYPAYGYPSGGYGYDRRMDMRRARMYQARRMAMCDGYGYGPGRGRDMRFHEKRKFKHMKHGRGNWQRY